MPPRIQSRVGHSVGREVAIRCVQKDFDAVRVKWYRSVGGYNAGRWPDL